MLFTSLQLFRPGLPIHKHGGIDIPYLPSIQLVARNLRIYQVLKLYNRTAVLYDVDPAFFDFTEHHK